MTVAINGRFLLDSFGGVRRFATELTEHLAHTRDDVILVAPPGASDIAVPGIRTHSVGRFGGPLWEQIELPRWLRRNGSPLLLNFANIAPLTYAKQISVLHDIAPAIRPQDFTFPFRVQWTLAVKYGMLRGTRPLVTVSEASQREIAARFRVPEERIEVIYEGADSLPEPRPSSVDARTAAPFVAFGRHGAAKNTRIIVDALASLSGHPIGVQFVGQLDPELEPYAAERTIRSGAIDWRGRVSDEELAEVFAAATAFIWPSLHEGFGLPPLEAQSFGVPIIASDIPINREILGDSALYFPAPDADALSARMREVAEDSALRDDLSRRSRANAERFTWAGTTAAWNDLIDRHV